MKGAYVVIHRTIAAALPDQGYVHHYDDKGIGVCDGPWTKNYDRFPDLFRRPGSIRFYPWGQVLRVDVGGKYERETDTGLK